MRRRVKCNILAMMKSPGSYLFNDNTLLAKKINIKHEISLFYSISRKPTLRIAKIEGIAYI